jgi:hypothetical protein
VSAVEQLVTLKVSRDERSHWDSLSDAAQDLHVNKTHYLVEKGYLDANVDRMAFAIKSAYRMKDQDPAQGLVYADGSRPRRQD